MGLVQRKSLVVFYLRMPRATTSRYKKEQYGRVNLASSIPWETVSSKKKREQASPSVPKVTEQTDVKSSGSREASSATRANIPCLWGAKCKISSCDCRHPPVSRNYKSGNGCIHDHRCQHRHADGEEKPSKRSKERGYSRSSCYSEG